MNVTLLSTLFSLMLFSLAFGQQTESIETHDFNKAIVEPIPVTDQKISMIAESEKVPFFAADTLISFVQFKLPPCPYTRENAKRNIDSNYVSLIIRGGFQGFPKEDLKKSEAFRKKHHVQFDYLGCDRFYDPEGEDLSGYNQIMKDYLVKRYGAKCMTEYEAIFD